MHKSAWLRKSLAVTTIGLVGFFSLYLTSCGGGGKGGIDFNPDLSYVSESSLNASQKNALRDLGLYGGISGNLIEIGLYSNNPAPQENPSSQKIISKELFINKMFNTAKNMKSLVGKEEINESDTEVIYGLSSGSSTIDYTCTGEETEEVFDESCDFTITAENFDFHGACQQVVRQSGVVTCHIDFYANSNGDYKAGGYCSSDGDILFAGADGIEHTIQMAYSFDLNGNLYDNSYNEKEEGWLKIDNIALKFEDLVAAPVCTNPSVIQSSPVDDSADVPVDTTISLSFNRDMDHSSVENSFSFQHLDPYTYDYTEVPGELSWDGKKMIFTPTEPLEYDSDYKANISEAKDTDGYPTLAEYELNFKTIEFPIVVSNPIYINKPSYDLEGIAWDGSNLWVLDDSPPNRSLYRINTGSGAVVGTPINATFTSYYAKFLEWDGANFWSMDTGLSPIQLVKIAADGSKASYIEVGYDSDAGLAFNNNNFVVYDSWNDFLSIFDPSGAFISQNKITDAIFAEALTWCDDSYWLLTGNSLCRVNSDLSSTTLCVEWTDSYESVVDATCDAASKKIWVASGSSREGIYSIQLP